MRKQQTEEQTAGQSNEVENLVVPTTEENAMETTATVENTTIDQAIEAAKLDPKQGILLNNNYDKSYLDNGYNLREGFKTRNREEAKDEAKRLRAEEGKLAVYVTLSGGWFGVFEKTAPQKEGKATQQVEAKPPVNMEHSFGEWSFKGTTKEARAWARLLVEAAKNAEYADDLRRALEKKNAPASDETTTD